jgi:hypothetical protein
MHRCKPLEKTMRQTLLAAAAAFVIGGVATGAVLSQAQPAPPPVQETDGGPTHLGPHPGMMGWRHHMMREGMRGRQNLRTFALVYRQDDRNLAPADVQKIAEAFLLWNGNHTWKVSNVAPTTDGPIGFSLTTPEGGVVARFTMDPHSGRIQRVG